MPAWAVPCMWIFEASGGSRALTYSTKASRVPAEVLRPLDDDARDPEPVGERLELDALHANRQRDADLLAPLRSDLVRLDVFTPIGRRTDQVALPDQVVQVPQVVRVLDADLDLPGLRVAVEDTHRVAGHGGGPSWPYRRMSDDGRRLRISSSGVTLSVTSPRDVHEAACVSCIYTKRDPMVRKTTMARVRRAKRRSRES